MLSGVEILILLIISNNIYAEMYLKIVNMHLELVAQVLKLING